MSNTQDPPPYSFSDAIGPVEAYNNEQMRQARERQRQQDEIKHLERQRREEARLEQQQRQLEATRQIENPFYDNLQSMSTCEMIRGFLGMLVYICFLLCIVAAVVYGLVIIPLQQNAILKNQYDSWNQTHLVCQCDFINFNIVTDHGTIITTNIYCDTFFSIKTVVTREPVRLESNINQTCFAPTDSVNSLNFTQPSYTWNGWVIIGYIILWFVAIYGFVALLDLFGIIKPGF